MSNSKSEIEKKIKIEIKISIYQKFKRKMRSIKKIPQMSLTSGWMRRQ